MAVAALVERLRLPVVSGKVEEAARRAERILPNIVSTLVYLLVVLTVENQIQLF